MKRLLYILPVILCFSSCSDGFDSGYSPEESDSYIEVNLSVVSPSTSVNRETRALTAEDEQTVTHLYTIVFKENSAGEYVYTETLTPTIIKNAGDTISARLSIQADNTYTQKLAIVANAEETVSALEASFSSLSFSEVMDLLVINRTNAWKSDTDDYDPLPMWGETDALLLSRTNSVPVNTTVSLIRSLARIDIAIAEAAQNDFQLHTVYLYNSYANGRIAPSSVDNWNSRIVSLPNDHTQNAPIVYSEMTTANHALERTIYTFEAPATSGNSASDGVCLILAGSWNGGEDTYYRVDFYDEGQDMFMPLLRNYTYTVNVTEVSGNGYATAEEALVAGFTNLTAEVFYLNETTGGLVIWDGRNWLSISTASMELYRSATDSVLTVSTNYYGTDALSIEVAEGSGWLTIDSESSINFSPSASQYQFDFTLSLLENTEGEVRTGVITVTAGRLSQQITVIQNPTNALSLSVGDVELIFEASQTETQTLQINWLPVDVPCAIEVLSIDGYTPIDLATLPDFTSTGGRYALPVTAQADNTLSTFAEKRSLLRVTAYDSSDSNASSVSWDVTLRQFDYDIVITGEQVEYQLATTYHFNVKSNSTWRLASYSDLLTLASAVSGDADTEIGETLSFKTPTGNNYAGTTVSFTLSSRLDPNLTVTIDMPLHMVYPNSYIMAPGTAGSLPLMKPYHVWLNDVDLNTDLSTLSTSGLGAELIWEDAVGLISNVTLDFSGGYDSGNINYNVSSGLTGNAVIAFTIDGEIYWSWHIWVLNEEPGYGYNSYNGITVMDRYLGAMAPRPTTGGDGTEVYGLYYQHGRKDPFPGPASTSGSGSKNIYNSAGTMLEEGTAGATGVNRVEVSEQYNFINAIRNPLTYYYGSGTQGAVSPVQYDWYTSGINDSHRSDLWGPGYKTEFDPCPTGWKVPDIDEFIFYFKEYREELATETYLDFSDIGYYPAQGIRNDTNGQISGRTTIRLWFTNNSTPGRSQYMLVNAASLLTTVSQNAMGAPIRCVRIE